jgi:tetratricopeptide (TPR) repeat protein
MAPDPVNESFPRVSSLIPLESCMPISRLVFTLGLGLAAVPPLSAAAAGGPAAPALPAPPAAVTTPAPPAIPRTDQTASAALLPAEVAAQAAIAARATPRLKELVSRQDALLAALGKEGADQDGVKRDIQNLIFEYDAFLRTHPTFAPGYVTYGLLLGKVGMRRESAAILLKANQLDPDIPIVKNQLGNYLAEEGEPIEAAGYFVAAVRLAPEEPLYHYQLGTVLTEARDDFLKSGQWSRPQLDRTMQESFKRAAELAPNNFAFAYRYAQSFYDLAEPNWDEALKVWGALEDQASPGLEKDTIRLHAAHILITQKKFDHARLLLAMVTAEQLKEQKQKLVDQLPADAGKPAAASGASPN